MAQGIMLRRYEMVEKYGSGEQIKLIFLIVGGFSDESQFGINFG